MARSSSPGELSPSLAASAERLDAQLVHEPHRPAWQARYRAYYPVKRFGDLLLLVPGALLAFPLILVAALAIVLVSPGNPFFAQERVGHRGRTFRLWKLRTMYLDADEVLETYLTTDERLRTEWENHYKLTDDPRIVPVVGKFLRRSSLDELPQLWNIARGHMSFVGPRPFPEYHLEAFDDEFKAERCSVVPGLTGLWQISDRADGDVAMQRELDGRYLRTWTPVSDLRILMRTPWSVLIGKGAR